MGNLDDTESSIRWVNAKATERVSPGKRAVDKQGRTIGVQPFPLIVAANDSKACLPLVNCCLGVYLENLGWEAGIRTPIRGSRGRSLTVRRPPSEVNNQYIASLCSG